MENVEHVEHKKLWTINELTGVVVDLCIKIHSKIDSRLF